MCKRLETIYCTRKANRRIFDLKRLALNVGQNLKINEIKMIRVEHENPFLFKYNTSYANISFKTIDIRKKCKT